MTARDKFMMPVQQIFTDPHTNSLLLKGKIKYETGYNFHKDVNMQIKNIKLGCIFYPKNVTRYRKKVLPM